MTIDTISTARRRVAALLATTALASGGFSAAAAAQETAAAVTLNPVTVEDAMPAPAQPIRLGLEEIEREQPQTLRDLFADQPAVAVSGGSIAAQKLFVHGIGQSKLNVTIDGARQHNNVWHHNGNLFLDPSLLKAVEVNPGVAPADAGFGAVGGSVAFETKDAADLLLPGASVGGRVTTTYDTNPDAIRGSVAGYGAARGFDVLGIVTREHGDNYENGNGAEETGTGTNLVNVLGKVGYESPAGHAVKVTAEHLNDDTIRRLRPNMGFVTPDMNRNDLTRTTLTAEYSTTAPTALFDPEVKLYYNVHELNRPNESGYTRPSGDFNSEVETIGGTVQNTFQVPLGSLTVGADFAHDDMTVERFHFPTDVSEEILQAGLFAQTRLMPVDRLAISAGLRGDVQRYEAVDGQTFENAGLSPNLSAEYQATDWLSLFGGYSYVWGGLEPSETALFHARDYTYAQDLEPTRAHNLRAGLRTEHEGFAFEGAWFQTLMRDVMDWNYGTTTRINGEDLESRGFDLIASYTGQSGGISAKYTHTDITYGDRIALPNDYNMGTAVGDVLTVSGHYLFDPLELQVGASAEHAFAFEHEDLQANGFDDLDSYTVVDLFAEWSPDALAPHVTLRAEANNVFDEAYVSRASFGETARVTPVLDPGRSFLLSSTIRF
ncbi:TonB-dependent receptor domain-containing protein [Caenispirillum salinarum]|uniref:TonB-dependent receptor domain-containing protein n=1 Tax=Caenispirillum salinarum TaxID=859058 RepID=UPI00384BE762